MSQPLPTPSEPPRRVPSRQGPSRRGPRRREPSHRAPSQRAPHRAKPPHREPSRRGTPRRGTSRQAPAERSAPARVRADRGRQPGRSPPADLDRRRRPPDQNGRSAVSGHGRSLLHDSGSRMGSLLPLNRPRLRGHRCDSSPTG
ncbi:hypothetical protein FLX07_04260 [Microbispora bryophytorum]|nr:hypothetical protein FLX07_04260 [Microbispora bryophytorum]